MNKEMFTKIGSGLNLSFDDSAAKSIPTILHVYNTPQPTRPDPFWMEFEKPKDPTISDQNYGHGTIAFTKWTVRLYPDLVNSVYDYFMSINPTFPWDKNRIQLLRTSGYILPHRDEPARRRTTINIGLQNSNCAETKFSNKNSLTDVTDTTNFIMEDGDAYLLDVFSVHSVHPIKPCNYRYLISYSMLRSYDVIKPFLVA